MISNIESISCISGSWETILKSQPELCDRFDIIIMCETLYNKEYYPSLHDLLAKCLKKQQNGAETNTSVPQILTFTKTFYFGLSGGFFDF